MTLPERYVPRVATLARERAEASGVLGTLCLSVRGCEHAGGTLQVEHTFAWLRTSTDCKLMLLGEK